MTKDEAIQNLKQVFANDKVAKASKLSLQATVLFLNVFATVAYILIWLAEQAEAKLTAQVQPAGFDNLDETGAMPPVNDNCLVDHVDVAGNSNV